MGYYQGDYYQGDYYQGDPFLGALIGAGVSWLGKKIFKRGLSPVAKAAVAVKSTAMIKRVLPIAAGAAVATGMTLPIPMTPFQMTPQAFLPGGEPLITRRRPMPLVQAPAGMPGMCPPSGFHLAKDGSGRLVRNRTMNVANPKALRRSLRRVAGFGKLAMRAKKDVRRAAKSLGA